MRKAAELNMSMIVGLIIALFVLALILFYVFSSSGGPKSLIDALLNFLNMQTENIQSTSNI